MDVSPDSPERTLLSPPAPVISRPRENVRQPPLPTRSASPLVAAYAFSFGVPSEAHLPRRRRRRSRGKENALRAASTSFVDCRGCNRALSGQSPARANPAAPIVGVFQHRLRRLRHRRGLSVVAPQSVGRGAGAG